MSDRQNDLQLALMALSPQRLDIRDDSAQHAHHQGHRGGSHFHVTIVSTAFEGLSLIARHRLVYLTVDHLLASNALHALSIIAKTPSEVIAVD